MFGLDLSPFFTPQGSSAAADYDDIHSPETYIGYGRFVGPDDKGPVRDVSYAYDAPREGLPHNAWGFRGLWTVGPEVAVLDKAPGGLVYRFHAAINGDAEPHGSTVSFGSEHA